MKSSKKSKHNLEMNYISKAPTSIPTCDDSNMLTYVVNLGFIEFKPMQGKLIAQVLQSGTPTLRGVVFLKSS